MQRFEGQTFDEERALYGLDGAMVVSCLFDGPEDGESALKECKDVNVKSSKFNLRYPFWHDNGVVIKSCDMTENCRAALWYSKDIDISESKLNGIKALRECMDIKIENCDIQSVEFGWFNENVHLWHSNLEGEYVLMRSKNVNLKHVKMKGKYSFQYIENATITNCNLDTKDAFWHAKNVLIKDCLVKGEYLGWYCENVTFENCTIIGTQPLCYCKGLKLINCEMKNCDLAFEKSDVDAVITSKVDSIKNPLSGVIRVLDVGEIIRDDPNSKGEIIFVG